MNHGTLIYARKGGKVQRFVLSPGITTLGRGPDNTVVLFDTAVALQHVQLECADDGCWVTDLGNNSGVLLNQEVLQPFTRHILNDGDIIQVGPFFIRYTLAHIKEIGAVPPAHSDVPPPPQPILPPEVAAQLPTPVHAPTNGVPTISTDEPFASARWLNGNGGGPRLPSDRYFFTDEGSSYIHYLPPPFQEVAFLHRFLLIFEATLDPLEKMIDQIHHYFDPLLVPEPLLIWLGSWVGVAIDENITIRQQRELVKCAWMLYLWRGTRRGMLEYLRIYTGVTPLIIEPGQADVAANLPPHVFAVILNVPEPEKLNRVLIERIIDAQKPAHTSYVLQIRSATT